MTVNVHLLVEGGVPLKEVYTAAEATFRGQWAPFAQKRAQNRKAMTSYDLCLAWNWEYDADFYAARYGLSVTRAIPAADYP